MLREKLPMGAEWIEFLPEELIPTPPRVLMPTFCNARNKLVFLADAYGFETGYFCTDTEEGTIRRTPIIFHGYFKEDGRVKVIKCAHDEIYHDENGVYKVVDYINEVVFRDFKNYIAFRFPFLTPEEIEYIALNEDDIPDTERMKAILLASFERAKRREFPALKFLSSSLEAMRSHKSKASNVPFATLTLVSEVERKRAEDVWVDALSNLGDEELAGAVRKRGFFPEEAADLGFGVTERGDIAIPTFDLGGIRNVVYRLSRKKPGEPDRYALENTRAEPGYWWELGEDGKPFWLEDDSIYAIALVQGYINALSWALAIPEHGVIGFQSARGISLDVAEAIASTGKPVILSTDGSSSGLKLRELVKAQLMEAGVPHNMIIIPIDDNLKRDPNDVLRAQGIKKLRKHLDKQVGRGKLLNGKISKGKIGARATIVGGYGETSRARAALFGAKRSSAYTRSYTLRHGYMLDLGMEILLKELRKLGAASPEVAMRMVDRMNLKPSAVQGVLALLASETGMIPKTDNIARSAARGGLLKTGFVEEVQIGRKKYLKLNWRAFYNFLKGIVHQTIQCLRELRKKSSEAMAIFREESKRYWGGFLHIACRLGSPLALEMAARLRS